MKKLIIAAAAALAFASVANAQTNLQTFYDFGRGYVTTTLEGFYGDNWGNTFFFIDHYYADKANQYGPVNGSYFEIERCLNFWKDSKLANLSLQVEYDGLVGGLFANSTFCFGLNYFLHSKDFKNTFNIALLYDVMFNGEADVPVKFSGVWGFQDLFGVSGLRFSGFIDIWGNNNNFKSTGEYTKVSVITEPQLWYNIGKCIGIDNLNIGGEVELSYNFAGYEGFKCNPCAGIKWIF